MNLPPCFYCGKQLKQRERWIWGCNCKEGKKISLSVG